MPPGHLHVQEDCMRVHPDGDRYSLGSSMPPELLHVHEGTPRWDHRDVLGTCTGMRVHPDRVIGGSQTSARYDHGITATLRHPNSISSRGRCAILCKIDTLLITLLA